ncbi:MAG: mechanosensitive ion channel family protein, partial [Candidatus Hydrogenedentota bacterium]
ETSRQIAHMISGPVRILLWFLFLRVGVDMIGPSPTVRSVMRGGTIFVIAVAWGALQMVDIFFNLWRERLRTRGQETVTSAFEPMRNFAKVIVILLAVMVWLDNVGFDISTLLAGLGVGGIAVALAAQDSLKNFIGSIMILVDRPYQIGQRIVARGHDGVVEEIGLRSTKVRLLTGHQTTIPNDEMARMDVENIGRRPHIRRLANITITYDTPLKKVEKAVSIIREILNDHEGMDPAFPPKAYFNEFNPASLNILVLYWYHPADYWRFMEFSQRVNMQIMEEFEKEGIKFAFPTTTTYLTQEDGQPFNVSMLPDSRLKVEAS